MHSQHPATELPYPFALWYGTFIILLFSRGNFLSGDETDFGVRFLPRFWPGVLSWASHQALRTLFRVRSCGPQCFCMFSMMVAGCCRSQCIHDFSEAIECPDRECSNCLHQGWTVKFLYFHLSSIDEVERWIRSRAVSLQNVPGAIISNWGICVLTPTLFKTSKAM
jgi:hypothetical protein